MSSIFQVAIEYLIISLILIIQSKEATKLKNDGVDIIIALGHSGYEVDKDIAKSCSLVDIVVGGHTHSFLFSGEEPDVEKPVGPYPTVVKQSNGKQVPVVQAYAFTKYIGVLKLSVSLISVVITFCVTKNTFIFSLTKMVTCYIGMVSQFF